MWNFYNLFSIDVLIQVSIYIEANETTIFSHWRLWLCTWDIHIHTGVFLPYLRTHWEEGIHIGNRMCFSRTNSELTRETGIALWLMRLVKMRVERWIFSMPLNVMKNVNKFCRLPLWNNNNNNCFKKNEKKRGKKVERRFHLLWTVFFFWFWFVRMPAIIKFDVESLMDHYFDGFDFEFWQWNQCQYTRDVNVGVKLLWFKQKPKASDDSEMKYFAWR